MWGFITNGDSFCMLWLIGKYIWKMAVTFSFTCFPTCLYVWHHADILLLGWWLKSAPCLLKCPFMLNFARVRVEWKLNVVLMLVTFHTLEVWTSCYIPSSSGLLQNPCLFIWSYLSDGEALQKCLNNCLQHWHDAHFFPHCPVTCIQYFLSPRHYWHLATVICQFPVSTIKTNKLLKPR